MALSPKTKEGKMLVVKAPLRISLFGGGTDLPHYCEKHGSTIISFAIDKYIYLAHNERTTGGYRITYSEVEELDNLNNIQHTLVRAATEKFGGWPSCTLTIVGDIPKGTGLGSSSALSVALCKLYLGELDNDELLETAFSLESSVNPQVGVQDFLPSIYGGLKVYTIDEDFRVTVGGLPGVAKEVISKYGLLLYTGSSRDAQEVLTSWSAPRLDNPLGEIHKIADSILRTPRNWFPKVLGDRLDSTWKVKRRAGNVSNSKLDEQYWRAKKAGVLGGKLCGAGQGGCWFFMVDPEKRELVKETLGLAEIPFQIYENPAVEVIV